MPGSFSKTPAAEKRRQDRRKNSTPAETIFRGKPHPDIRGGSRESTFSPRRIPPSATKVVPAESASLKKILLILSRELLLSVTVCVAVSPSCKGISEDLRHNDIAFPGFGLRGAVRQRIVETENLFYFRNSLNNSKSIFYLLLPIRV